jgi:hypothetical protein
MSGCNDSDFLEKPFTENPVSRDLATKASNPAATTSGNLSVVVSVQTATPFGKPGVS